MPQGYCEEKARLRSEYQLASELYTAAIGQTLGPIHGDVELAMTVAEDAGVASQQARARLDAHIAEHGC
jgi:hypothetical protein